MLHVWNWTLLFQLFMHIECNYTKITYCRVQLIPRLHDICLYVYSMHHYKNDKLQSARLIQRLHDIFVWSTPNYTSISFENIYFIHGFQDVFYTELGVL
jgi:hypothetical protein